MTSVSHQGNKIGELKLIQCSIKVSFQGQRNPQKCKYPNKITSFKAWDLLQIKHTPSNFGIYTFPVRYSLASRSFPKAKYSVVYIWYFM